MEIQGTAVDFQKLCRLCLTQENSMSSIFAEDETHSVPLPLRIMACVSIDVRSADCLPSHICDPCLYQVNGWYKFKDLCETADTLLKQYLQNEPISLDRISQVQEIAKQWKNQFTINYSVDLCKENDSHDKKTGQKKKLTTNDNSDEDDGKLYKYLKFGVKNDEIKREIDENVMSEEDDEDDESGDDEDDDSESIESPSSDDSLVPLVSLKNKKTRYKKQEEVKTKQREARTICTQTGDSNNDFNYEQPEVLLTVVEDRQDENDGKKKIKSIKTQTPREKSVCKKRIRVRPAVPSACNLCDKIYKNSEILRQHMKSHHVTGTIECSACKMTFTSLRSLKYHEQRKHSNLEPVPCSFCGKNFLDKKYLRIHENIHSQNNQYVCQFCGRKFIMKTNLTVHISRHHSLKTNDFICQVCGKAFPFKLYLKKHFKTHTDYKPHACTYCDAKFREKTLLRKHVNSIHLKLRPFLCHYCNKTFTRGLYLREHMESQHLGIQKKIECVRCGENFQNRNRLRLHECEGRLEVQL